MPYKKDDKGNLVLGEKGNPVLLYSDGTENKDFDPDDILKERAEQTASLKTYQEKAATLEREFEKFKSDYGDLLKDPDNTRKALETLKNIKDGELLQANKVEELKDKIRKETAEGYDKKIKDMTAEWDKTHGSLKTENDTLRGEFYTSKLESEFGKQLQEDGVLKKLTNIKTVGMAMRLFGGQFSPEKTEKGFRIGAYKWGGDQQIISTGKNAGEPAGIAEALKVLIETSPFRADISPAVQGGPGGNSGLTGGGGNSDIESRYNEAVKAGNMTLAVSLKRQMHELGIKRI